MPPSASPALAALLGRDGLDPSRGARTHPRARAHPRRKGWIAWAVAAPSTVVAVLVMYLA